MTPIWLKTILTGGVSLITETVGEWNKRRKMKLEHKTEMVRIRAKRKERREEAEIEWDNRMAMASETSWKDEYWTIILSIPMIMCFIPQLVVYVEDGFEALAKTPDWYKCAIGLAIAASFGYRKYADYTMKRSRMNGQRPEVQNGKDVPG